MFHDFTSTAVYAVLHIKTMLGIRWPDVFTLFAHFAVCSSKLVKISLPHNSHTIKNSGQPRFDHPHTTPTRILLQS